MFYQIVFGKDNYYTLLDFNMLKSLGISINSKVSVEYSNTRTVMDMGTVHEVIQIGSHEAWEIVCSNDSRYIKARYLQIENGDCIFKLDKTVY